MQCPKCHFQNPEDTVYCGKCSTPLPSAKDVPFSHTETFQAFLQELTTGSTFADRETIERFSNELRLARKIGHRNVCRMFDLCKDADPGLPEVPDAKAHLAVLSR